MCLSRRPGAWALYVPVLVDFINRHFINIPCIVTETNMQSDEYLKRSESGGSMFHVVKLLHSSRVKIPHLMVSPLKPIEISIDVIKIFQAFINSKLFLSPNPVTGPYLQQVKSTK